MAGFCNQHTGYEIGPGCRMCQIECCDFCRGVPQWDYPAKDFVVSVMGITQHEPIEEIVDLGPTGSRGGWAACAECHDLIEAGRWSELADRSIKADWDGQGGYQRSRIGLEVWKNAIMQFHRAFQSSRTGPAIEWFPDKNSAKVVTD